MTRSEARKIDMTITPRAEKRLRRWLDSHAGRAEAVLRLVSVLGTCAGAAPRFELSRHPAPDDAMVRWNGGVLYVAAEVRGFADGATLDGDGGLFGRGLVIRRPHRPGCTCSMADVEDGDAAE